MQVVYGIRRDGQLRIVTAEAGPQIGNFDEVLPVSGFYDWGRDAFLVDRVRTALAILTRVADNETAKRLAELYAEDVVAKMHRNAMWQLSYDEIKEWIELHGRVQ